jgi:hypothetical protein
MKEQDGMAAERIGWLRGRRARTRPLALVTLLAGMAASMVGCGGASTSATPTATPTATATPAPQTLYQADWAARPGEWKLPAHWSIVNGQLVNDGQSAAVLAVPVPYVVTAQRYTLHMDIRALAANGPGVNNMYGVLGQTPDGKLLYTAEASSVEHTLHSYAIVYPASPDPNSNNTFGTADFTPGRSTRPYVVQSDGQDLSFITGGGLIGTVRSATPLAPVRFVLVDQNVQLVVESLTITTP